MTRPVPLLSVLCAALLFFASATSADEVQEITRMAKQGQQDKALERANSYLTTHPKDAQIRFVKGVILTEQNKAAEAIKVFTGITEDYPELPEPYNNLAVLYASLGQYDKAKTALEMAINTHPSYAIAHENLGDIYAKMASQAYDKALQLDKGNTNAQAKLSLIKEIFSKQVARPAMKSATPPPSTPAAATPVAKAVPPPVMVAAAKPAQPTEIPAKAAPLPVVAKPAPAAEPAKSVAVAKAPPPEKAVRNKAEGKADESEAVLGAVKAWARAWSAKNVAGYLRSYAPDLVLPKGENRANWEQTRRERISRPKSIAVTIHSLEVRMVDPVTAKVTFKQVYRSSSLNSETWKTLMMIKTNGKWLIHEERIGRS